MENALPASSGAPSNFTWPDEASLAAFRAWLQGVPSRAAVDRYLPDRRTAGESSRSVIGRVKRQLVAFATGRAQAGLAATLSAASPFDRKLVKAGPAAIETLRGMPPPQPLLGDAVERWLPVRLVGALHAVGIRTLADLTLRVPRRRRWWAEIAGLGPAGARHIEAFFAQHPALTERARALVTVNQAQELIPWERLIIPEDVDGSRGTFRAPRASCALDACNDYQAVNAWLSLHESTATQRAYRKEGERLMLWAIVERGRALSSLTTEDAIAYRAFLRHPGPRARWVGTPQPRWTCPVSTDSIRTRASAFQHAPVQGYPRGLPVDSSLHHPVHRACCPQVRSTLWVTRARPHVLGRVGFDVSFRSRWVRSSRCSNAAGAGCTNSRST